MTKGQPPKTKLEILRVLTGGPASITFIREATGVENYLSTCLKAMAGDGLIVKDGRTGAWAITIAGHEYLEARA